MKKLLAFFSYLLIAIFFVIFFLPKVNLYYKAEELLHKKSIVMTQEGIDDSGFSLNLSEAKLYYGDLYVAEFSSISITSLLIYNSLHVESFSLSKEMKQFVPTQVEGVDVVYTIFNPFNITIEASGAFGTLEGGVNLSEHKILLHLNASATLLKQKPFWLRKLKKIEGEYVYESHY